MTLVLKAIVIEPESFFLHISSVLQAPTGSASRWATGRETRRHLCSTPLGQQSTLSFINLHTTSKRLICGNSDSIHQLQGSHFNPAEIFLLELQTDVGWFIASVSLCKASMKNPMQRPRTPSPTPSFTAGTQPGRFTLPSPRASDGSGSTVYDSKNTESFFSPFFSLCHFSCHLDFLCHETKTFYLTKVTVGQLKRVKHCVLAEGGGEGVIPSNPQR